MVPKTNPELWKASGMAKIPVPRDPLSKCIRVSRFLPKNMNMYIPFENIYLNHKILIY